MKEIIEDKGRIRPVVEGDFQCDENGNSTRVYEILSIVGCVDGNTKLSYISKKFVPVGIPITNSEYWYSLQVIAVPKGDKGDKGDDGISPILRVSPDGMSIEISSDNGQTWVPFVVDFNKLRVIGYVDSLNQLPRNAQVGDIYGVWESEPTEENPEAGVYRLYINTVKDWLLDYTITKVYDYDTEIPSSATDGTAVLVPVRDLTLDKEKVDGYKVYRYNQDILGWTMVLNTAEIYAEKEDIINYGDNVFALVQGATEGTYELYKRVTGWVYFGTNASITYHLVQNVEDGTEQNVLSGKAVKDALAAEKSRAEAQEQDLETAIGEERTRAMLAEGSNTQAVLAERNRAIEAEQNLNSSIANLRNYVDTEFTELDERLDALEQSNLKLTLTANPNKTFEKGVAENITLTASLGSITPTSLDIKLGNVKLNDGNNNTAVYSSALTQDSTMFTARATYYDAVINTNLTLQARYPIYYGFGATAAEVAQSYASSRIVATSAARTYTRTSETAGNYFIIVPPDVTPLNSFTMGGAPFVMTSTTATINGVAGYRVYKSGVEYVAGTAISVVAS